ncbi:MAG: DUF86 domain-containing protein [Planctomycetaceae bacterium]|jgi:uncharacterized protein with HEPN domain|nr:DUF86 domain-containing protein [Planctomycetaceae bacterium]
MKNPDINVYIQDMKNASVKIIEIVEDISFEQFESESVLHLAIERLFEILGEAANRVPKDIQLQHATIPWSSIIGMRNIIIHSYDKVNPEQLWVTIQEDLRILVNNLNTIK